MVILRRVDIVLVDEQLLWQMQQLELLLIQMVVLLHSQFLMLILKQFTLSETELLPLRVVLVLGQRQQ